MAGPARNYRILKVGFSEEDFTRIAYHADRSAVDRSVLVQLSMIERLDVLDEKVAFQRANKNAMKGEKQGAKIGALPSPTGAQGMQIEFVNTVKAANPFAPTPKEVKVPEKIEKSFKRYCDYVEAADGLVDKTMRLQTVLDDMKERVTDEEAAVSFAEFKTKLAMRAEARPPKIVKVPENIPVAGDVD